MNAVCVWRPQESERVREKHNGGPPNPRGLHPPPPTPPFFGDFFLFNPPNPPTPRLAAPWGLICAAGVCRARRKARFCFFLPRSRPPGHRFALAPFFHPPNATATYCDHNARVNPYHNKNKRGFLFFFSNLFFFWREEAVQKHTAVSSPFAGAAPKKTSFYLFFLPLLTRNRS